MSRLNRWPERDLKKDLIIAECEPNVSHLPHSLESLQSLVIHLKHAWRISNHLPVGWRYNGTIDPVTEKVKIFTVIINHRQDSLADVQVSWIDA